MYTRGQRVMVLNNMDFPKLIYVVNAVGGFYEPTISTAGAHLVGRDGPPYGR